MTWANENGRAVIRCDGAGCTLTVDALEDDWITAVTMAPVTAPRTGFPVSLANSTFI